MSVKPVPDGYHTVVPYLTVKDASSLLEFVQRAFGAQTQEVMRTPNGQVMHADVMIGDSHVMLGQAGGEWGPMQASLYLYVPDCDAMYQAALAAGGTSVREPRTEFYGDRSGGVLDPCGNQWWMATHVEDVSKEEMERRSKAFMDQKAKG